MQIKQITILIFLFQVNHYHTTNSANPRPATRTDIHDWTHAHFEQMVATRKFSTHVRLKEQITREACKGIVKDRKALPSAFIARIMAQDPDGELTDTINQYNALLDTWATK